MFYEKLSSMTQIFFAIKFVPALTTSTDVGLGTLSMQFYSQVLSFHSCTDASGLVLQNFFLSKLFHITETYGFPVSEMCCRA